LREAAGGRSERGAIQENRASRFRTNLSPTAVVRHNCDLLYQQQLTTVSEISDLC
jgi:hypothetical protein